MGQETTFPRKLAKHSMLSSDASKATNLNLIFICFLTRLKISIYFCAKFLREPKLSSNTFFIWSLNFENLGRKKNLASPENLFSWELLASWQFSSEKNGQDEVFLASKIFQLKKIGPVFNFMKFHFFRNLETRDLPPKNRV